MSIPAAAATPGMTTTPIYCCYGLWLRSEIPLDAPVVGGPVSSVDVTIGHGEDRLVGTTLPAGDRVAIHRLGSRWLYALVERPEGGFLLRFPGCCDVMISPELDAVTCCPARDGRAELIPVLVQGAVLAVVLSLRGEAVLHASGVAFDGAAIAFVGPSGTGKSTVAALCCAAGARLVTDDVLRVDTSGPQPRAATGPTRLRLRRKAEELLRQHPTLTVDRVTADDRLALAPPVVDDAVALEALVIPRPARDTDRVSVVRLSPLEAVGALSAAPRIFGWTRRQDVAREFAIVAELARRLPVLSARLPWGPPFPDGLVDELLFAIRS